MNDATFIIKKLGLDQEPDRIPNKRLKRSNFDIQICDTIVGDLLIRRKLSRSTNSVCIYELPTPSHSKNILVGYWSGAREDAIRISNQFITELKATSRLAIANSRNSIVQ